MKIAYHIVRILLGLAFFASGLMVLLHLMQPPPLPQGPAGAFTGALMSTGYLYAVKVLETIGGALLLIGRYVPLGLTILGPIIVNILFYDIFLDHTALIVGIVVAMLALFLLYYRRSAFAGLLQP
jgi:uncharacterized membrane protein YphA (DoxX/SURF4 family)